MKKWSILAYLLVLAMVLAGCGKSGEQKGQSGEGQTEKQVNSSEMFTDRDYEVGYDESTSVRIEFNGDSASCSSDAVRISGSTVTITEEATYILSGTLNDGMIVVNAKDTDKLQLVLDNASITSKTSAPIYILEADKVFITLATDSENTLANGGEFVAIDDNNIDGTVFSKQDLTFNGAGSLNITSPAGHGIVCKDDLVFTSGIYTIQSASHGLDANDSVRGVNATFTIASGKDGVHTENSDDTSLGFVYLGSGTYDISAEGDGISAGAYMQIENGTYNIVSGGGSENAAQQSSDSWGGFPGGGMGGPGGGQGGGGRMPDGGGGGPRSSTDVAEDDSSTSIKGIKATQRMVINGGTFTLDCADDAIHSNESITVAGGNFQIATGDDGFHADDTLTIAGGTLDVTESHEGLEGLHIYVRGGDIKLVSSDDGINAAGGTDESGYGGHRGNDMFGGMGGPGGGSASNGSITISGGSIYMNASGDGIDANGTLEITGGKTVVCGPTQGDTAVLDYDTSAVITGGTFIGTGSHMMAQSFSDSEQGVIALSVGNQAEGTEITLEDEKGNTLISCTPELSYAIVILSSPDIVKGETYTVAVGQTSGKFEAN